MLKTHQIAGLVRQDRRRGVYDRVGGLCYVCGQQVSLKNYTVEHIIPKVLGGPDEADNRSISHQACNQLKADRLIAGVGFEDALACFVKMTGKTLLELGLPVEPRPVFLPKPPKAKTLSRPYRYRIIPLFDGSATGWTVIAWHNRLQGDSCFSRTTNCRSQNYTATAMTFTTTTNSDYSSDETARS